MHRYCIGHRANQVDSPHVAFCSTSSLQLHLGASRVSPEGLGSLKIAQLSRPPEFPGEFQFFAAPNAAAPIVSNLGNRIPALRQKDKGEVLFI